MIQFFDAAAVTCAEGMLIYGRVPEGAVGRPSIVDVESTNDGKRLNYEIIWSEDRPDFAIQLPAQPEVRIRWKDGQGGAHAALLRPYLAFDAPHLPLRRSQLPKEQRLAISTMTLGDEDRVEEWVRYHASLGITDFLIFHNSSSASPVLARLADAGVSVVAFPYEAKSGEHWNNVQRSSLNIGAAALRDRVAFVAFTDVDEFIAVAGERPLRELLQTTGSIQLTGPVLTNQRTDAPVRNDVLAQADRYCAQSTPKIILATSDLAAVPFVYSPHEYPAADTIPQTEAKLFHMWLNDRCTCAPNAERILLDERTHWQVQQGAHMQQSSSPGRIAAYAAALLLLLAAAFLVASRMRRWRPLARA